MIPTTLAEWTLPAIAHLLDQGYSETETFDFKELLPHPSDEGGKQRLTKACCAFANSVGGFIVFGIKDHRDDKGVVRPAQERLAGIGKAVDFLEHFGNYPRRCMPTIGWDFKNPPIALANGNVIHVVQIAMGLSGPYGFADHGSVVFWKRTNKGDESMTYDEIRLAFVGRQRMRAATLRLRAELQEVRERAGELGGRVDIRRYFYPLRSDGLRAAVNDVRGFVELGEALDRDLHEAASSFDRLGAMVQQARERGEVPVNYPHATLAQLAQNNGQQLDQLCLRCEQELKRLGLWE